MLKGISRSRICTRLPWVGDVMQLLLLQSRQSRAQCVPVTSYCQTVVVDASFTSPTNTISSFSKCLFWPNKSFISVPTDPSEEVQSRHRPKQMYTSSVLVRLSFSLTTYTLQNVRLPLCIENAGNNFRFENTMEKF